MLLQCQPKLVVELAARPTWAGTEPGFELGGTKLKTIFFMKIKTNTYFIFNKILHIK